MPLLRLPTEIRQCIWEYAIGSKIFLTKKIRRIHSFTPHDTKLSNGVALLRVCRQIYSETALLPCRLGIFTFDYIPTLVQASKQLKTYVREQVTHLRFLCGEGIVARRLFATLGGPWYLLSDAAFAGNSVEVRELFPALERIDVLLEEPLQAYGSGYTLQGLTEHIAERLHYTLEETGCELRVIENVAQVGSEDSE